MNPDEFVSITRGLVKRGWTEIEPKVAASFVTGGLSGILLAILASYHVPITPTLQQWAPYVIAIAGGYIFPSSGQVIVTKTSADQHVATTKTTGAVETIVTGAVPIQSAKSATQTPVQASAQAFLSNLGSQNNTADNATAVHPDNLPTEIVPPRSGGWS